MHHTLSVTKPALRLALLQKVRKKSWHFRENGVKLELPSNTPGKI
jgi:hypothetical protein